jgi:hypothetical protein
MLSDFASFTVGLLAAFGAFIIYTRFRNRLDSNIPLMFYALMIVYVNKWEGPPAWLVYAGLALALVLRFEFMNETLTRIVKLLDIGAVCAIIYFLIAPLFLS